MCDKDKLSEKKERKMKCKNSPRYIEYSHPPFITKSSLYMLLEAKAYVNEKGCGTLLTESHKIS